MVVDLAASDLGGNVDGSVPDATVVTDDGVTVVGAGNLPSAVPAAASTAYARNVVALLAHLVTRRRARRSTWPTRSPPASWSPTTARSCTRPCRALLNGEPA